MASGVAVWVCRGGPFYSSSPVPNAYLGLAKAGVLPTGSLCMQKYEINRVVSWWRGSNMVPATGVRTEMMSVNHPLSLEHPEESRSQSQSDADVRGNRARFGSQIFRRESNE